MMSAPSGKEELETKFKIVRFIKSQGYPAELYDNVITEDNYILTLYRIPHGKRNKQNGPKPVVLLMHGVPSNSADYISIGSERGLGFLLSELGYDVWLHDTRGTQSSRKHVYLDSYKDSEYWKFGFEEIALYDLPAILNKIESITSLRTISFIGHSMGTVTPFILLSEKPEYNERFNLIIAISQMVFFQNLLSIPYRFLQVTRLFWMYPMIKAGYLIFLPDRITQFIRYLMRLMGKDSKIMQVIVRHTLFVMNGVSDQFVKDDIEPILEYYPDSSPLSFMQHASQVVRTGKFLKPDHGCKTNKDVYGTTTPPPYNLNNVLCPVVAMCSSADVMSQPKDSRILRDHLPNCIALHEFEDPVFNHSDFLMGRYAKEKVFVHIFRYLEKYSKLK